jgi:putative PIN family toxin of toxin-antitoxin system
LIRAVLDTNVLVSAFASRHGPPRRLWEAFEADMFELYISEPILKELETVLGRDWFKKSAKFNDNEINDYLALIQTSAVKVKPLQKVKVIAEDPDDDAIVATALAASANFVVTGDRHLLTLKQWQDITIVNPRQFLEILLLEQDTRH